MGLVLVIIIAVGFIVVLVNWGMSMDQQDAAYRAGDRVRIFYPENYRTTGFGSANIETLRSLYLQGVRHNGYELATMGYQSFLRYAEFMKVNDKEAADAYEAGYTDGRTKLTDLRNTLSAIK